LEFVLAAYKLDKQGSQRLEFYQQRVEEIAESVNRRGNIRDAQSILNEASKGLPELSANFQATSQRMKVEYDRFFSLLRDDLLLLEQIERALGDAQSQASTPQAGRQLQDIRRIVELQRDSLRSAQRQRSRLAVQRTAFNLSESYREALEKAISGERWQYYQELLRRYQ
jgi:hypothetical protein